LGNPDSNFYAYPLPIIPVMDARKREIIRIDKLATGGKGDGLHAQTHNEGVIDHCRPSEYAPEFLKDKLRKDLKPLNVIQPEGVSFTITDGYLIDWQKWRFRLGFNPREGATLHDVTYDGRQLFYRLSMSEMVCLKLFIFHSQIPKQTDILFRLFLMQTLALHFLASKPLTLVMEDLAIAPTILHWAVIVSAKLHTSRLFS
jgi:hypothetical protein